MATVAVKSITTMHPTTISIMRIMLTDPSDSVGDESGVAGSGSEVTSGDSLVWKDIVVADSVDVVGSVSSSESVVGSVTSSESVPPTPALSSGGKRH